MSKHIFQRVVQERLYQVELGWDKPLQRYYCCIFPVLTEGERAGEVDDPVYSNLFEKNPQGLTLEYFVEVCRRHGIEVPGVVLNEVVNDRQENVVNRVVMY